MHGYFNKEEWQIKIMVVFFFIAHKKGFKFYAQPQTGAYSCFDHSPLNKVIKIINFYLLLLSYFHTISPYLHRALLQTVQACFLNNENQPNKISQINAKLSEISAFSENSVDEGHPYFTDL